MSQKRNLKHSKGLSRTSQGQTKISWFKRSGISAVLELYQWVDTNDRSHNQQEDLKN